MAMFPIHDLAREADIRVRRRRAALLLAGIVMVPWMMFHDAQHHGRQRRNRSARPGLDIMITGLPALGWRSWSGNDVAGGLSQPMDSAPRRSFQAGALTVDLSCASSLTVLPKPDLDDQVIVSVRHGQDASLQTLTLKDGVIGQSASCEDASRGDFIVQAAPDHALTLRQNGDIDIRGGRFTGPVTVEASGSGTVALAATGNLVDRQPVSGDVSIGEVAGTVEAELHGSGDLTIGEGAIPHLSLQSSGSGDIVMRHAVIGGGTIMLAGSGDFTADRIRGRIEASTSGSGDIAIGSIVADTVQLDGGGSGDIIVRGGGIGVLTADRRGSGDLVVRAVIQTATIAHHGDGTVTIPHIVRTGQPDGGDSND